MNRDGTISVRLDQGLIGFENYASFTLAPIAEAPPFSLLQSTQAADLSFIVVQAADAVPDFDPTIPAWLGARLEAEQVEQIELFLLVTVSGDGAATVNLRAPLVLWHERRHGVQAVIDQALPLRHPIPRR